MAQDSEKRFHQIMDKLFSSPRKPPPPSSSTSSPAEQPSRGKKRPNPASALALVEPKAGLDIIDKSSHVTAPAGSSRAPLCRPWDRGDLMKRLATFKSMTWFAKPQVISAVNCARRGWVNVDMDTIACESCGAHLLFSSPSSWSQQQVEKAASVFSLKLDNGHKLLCPWIDNSCEETLAEFPPMTPEDLVERFQERSSALLQLLALPVNSLSAIEYMRRPELEEFLNQPITPACSNIAAEVSQPLSLGNNDEASSAQLYYQAQKLISLCGWEPRTLPYIVDCKEKPSDSVRNPDIINLLPQADKGEHLSISAQSLDTGEISENNDNPVTHDTLKSDPNSVVLDCKLCGACAGLWVFSTVPRPLELFRVTGYAEVNTEKNLGGHDSGSRTHPNQRAIVLEQTSNLKLTIAGGPPATKQSFKATISLPIIGRNLRTRFASDTRDCAHGVDDHSISMGSEQVSQSENRGLLESTKDDQRHDSDIQDQQHKTTENSDALMKESDQAMSAIGEREAESGKNDSDVQENNSISLGNGQVSQSENRGLLENAKDDGGHESAIRDQQLKTTENCDALGKENEQATSAIEERGSENGRNDSDVQENIAALIKNQEAMVERSISPVNNKTKDSTAGKDVRQSATSSKQMEFDPIRQHRHFCPWITSMGRRGPGWRQTLSALQRHKDSLQLSPSATSLIKVDDPVTSVRNLFMSPSPKRHKVNKGSSG